MPSLFLFLFSFFFFSPTVIIPQQDFIHPTTALFRPVQTEKGQRTNKRPRERRRNKTKRKNTASTPHHPNQVHHNNNVKYIPSHHFPHTIFLNAIVSPLSTRGCAVVKAEISLNTALLVSSFATSSHKARLGNLSTT